MPTPLRVQLNEEEDEALQQLSLSDGPAPIVKQRALALRLNAEGWNASAIAQHLYLHEQTVRQALKRWQSTGLIPNPPQPTRETTNFAAVLPIENHAGVSRSCG